MADKKFSQLDPVVSLTGAELVPVVQTDLSKRTTTQDIANLSTSDVNSVNGLNGHVVLDQDDIADGTGAKQFTAAEKTKLAGISGTNTGDNATNTQYSGLATSKQDVLVSATNIKTINGSSILGSGDLVISGGSGITRSIVVTSGNVSAGAMASTDYVYLIAGAHTVTLPTAVSNTNRYTIKNNHSASVALAFTGAETADGGGVTLAPQASVDLISNGTNWSII